MVSITRNMARAIGQAWILAAARRDRDAVAATDFCQIREARSPLLLVGASPVAAAVRELLVSPLVSMLIGLELFQS